MSTDADADTSPAVDPSETRANLPRWGWALVVAVGVLLFVCWNREDASVARISPPSHTWFGSGQSAQVELTAGEPKTIYWEFTNAIRSRGRRGAGVRATAECWSVDAQSGAEVRLTRIGGDLRVGDWKALFTVKPQQTGTVRVVCHAKRAKTSTFGVGQEVPAPRLFNGVANYSGNGLGMILVGLTFLIPAVIVFSFFPVKPIAKAWFFRFWAPLLIAAALILSFSSAWNGFLFWIIWYGVVALSGWRRRTKDPVPPQRDGDGDGDAPVFYAGLSVFFLALFVLNICTHGHWWGIFAAGGLAVLNGYVAYRSWAGLSSRKGRSDVS
jgi:hypothetical protein